MSILWTVPKKFNYNQASKWYRFCKFSEDVAFPVAIALIVVVPLLGVWATKDLFNIGQGWLTLIWIGVGFAVAFVVLTQLFFAHDYTIENTPLLGRAYMRFSTYLYRNSLAVKRVQAVDDVDVENFMRSLHDVVDIADFIDERKHQFLVKTQMDDFSRPSNTDVVACGVEAGLDEVEIANWLDVRERLVLMSTHHGGLIEVLDEAQYCVHQLSPKSGDHRADARDVARKLHKAQRHLDVLREQRDHINTRLGLVKTT